MAFAGDNETYVYHSILTQNPQPEMCVLHNRMQDVRAEFMPLLLHNLALLQTPTI